MEFKFGNKTYKLKYGVKALMELEDYFKAPISKIAEKFSSGNEFSIKDIFMLFKAGLLKNKPSPQDEEIEEMIDELGFKKVSELVAKAFSESFNPDENVQKQMQNF